MLIDFLNQLGERRSRGVVPIAVRPRTACRLLGCGKLIVESPGEQGQLLLTEIPQVKKVQETLFELVGDETARVGQAGGTEHADG